MSEMGRAPLKVGHEAVGTTCYRRQGAGEALILIHGVGMRADVWAPQIAALSKHYDVVAYDMLGHGGASLPPEAPQLSHYSDQLLALLDHLGIAKAHIVGHSMGALVALAFTLSHPSRVLSVVALNAVYCRSPEQRAAVWDRATMLDGMGVGERIGVSAAAIARWFGNPVPAHLSGVARDVESFLNSVNPVGYARTYRLFSTSDAAHRDQLAQLSVPALFITGSLDSNSTPAMSEAMARTVRNGRVEIVENARHMMALVSPDDINRRLLTFLESVGQKVAGEPFDRGAFRKTLGAFLTGVTIVATRQEDGVPRGFTANSFTSVSLDPPLVLVCIAKSAASYPVFSSTGHFSVNVLAEAQKDVSALFASKAADKFAHVAWWNGPAGSPILDNVSAWFDCRQHKIVDAGDHIILIGEVQGFDQASHSPLGYCRGNYVTFGLSLDALAAGGSRTRVGIVLEHDGAVVLVEKPDGKLAPPMAPALGPASDPASLISRLNRLGLVAEFGFLFAVFEDPQAGAGATSIFYRGTIAAPPPPDGVAKLFDFDSIPWSRIGDEAIRVMLARFIKERREDQFGIYVGDTEKGAVQQLARLVPSLPTPSFGEVS